MATPAKHGNGKGHQVQVTLRGDEALEICRLFRPDVVIADVNMPGSSGYAIARELRERHGGFAPLMIAVSGVWTTTADRLLGQAVGCDHYLLKPCDPKELIRLIERYAAVNPMRAPHQRRGGLALDPHENVDFGPPDTHNGPVRALKGAVRTPVPP